MRRVVAVVFGALLTTCTTSGLPHPTVSSSVEDATSFVRGCDSAVFGEVNTKNAVMIGPLMLVGIPQAANLPRRAFEPHMGRYGAIKILAVVNGSSDVTVTLPESQQGSVRLLYDPDAKANKHGFLLSAGDARVTFKACHGIEPQYNGGFLAQRPICLTLEVQSEGSSTSGWISLGAGFTCPD